MRSMIPCFSAQLNARWIERAKSCLVLFAHSLPSMTRATCQGFKSEIARVGGMELVKVWMKSLYQR